MWLLVRGEGQGGAALGSREERDRGVPSLGPRGERSGGEKRRVTEGGGGQRRGRVHGRAARENGRKRVIGRSREPGRVRPKEIRFAFLILVPFILYNNIFCEDFTIIF
jgi:hypothetical protein